jgi:hypothetical protein
MRAPIPDGELQPPGGFGLGLSMADLDEADTDDAALA